MAGEDKAREEAEAKGRTGAPKQSERDVGHALRSVYVAAVNEDIPPELLDLLGKLD